MGKTKIEREKEKDEIALFRFAVISPLVSNPNEYKSKEEFYRTAALKKYVLPDGTETSFSAGLIKKWYIEYTRNGFEILKPKTRIDRGASRLLVGYQFYLNDNAINFQAVLKQAIKIYGVPKKLFVDNRNTI